MPKAQASKLSTPSPVPAKTPAGERGKGPHEVRDHLRLIAEMTREFTASHNYKIIVHSCLERIDLTDFLYQS